MPAARSRAKAEHAPPVVIPLGVEAYLGRDAHLGVAADVWAQTQRALHEPAPGEEAARHGERTVVGLPDGDTDDGVGSLLLECGDERGLRSVCYHCAHEDRRAHADGVREERIARPGDLGGRSALVVCGGLCRGSYVRDVHCIWQVAHWSRAWPCRTLQLLDLVEVAEERELQRECQW